MTAVAAGSIVLLTHDRGEDVELAREAGVELPGDREPSRDGPRAGAPAATPSAPGPTPSAAPPGPGDDVPAPGERVLFGLDVGVDGRAPGPVGGGTPALVPPDPTDDPGPAPDDNEDVAPDDDAGDDDDAGGGDTTGIRFSITGSPDGPLSPGTARAVDLTFSNPHADAITVTSLSVSVTATDRPTACPVSPNFTVTQFGPPYTGLVLPARGRTSLSALGIAEARWPRVAMVETGRNQDGCRGAALTLSFTGTAEGDEE